jgi:hypothetical protein
MRKLLLVVLVTVVGCTAQDGDDNPTTGGLKQGLTLFTADPTAGVTGMYARGDLAVFFDTAREVELDPAPQHDHFTKDGTAVNVSVRFTDMEGRNLLVSQDAHLVPDAWMERREPTAAMLAARPALYELTLAAGQELGALADEQPDVAPELQALSVTGVLMRPPQIQLPVRSLSGAYFSDGWDHWQYFEVHSGSCCAVAEHSATVFWNYSASGGWEDGWQTSNHGRWAMEMGLEGDCGGSGAWAGGGGRPHYYGDRLQYCDMKNGYSACGMFGGNHNCHDDSKLQRENIVYGAWYGSAPGYCSGWGCDLNAPGCW